MRTPLPMAIAAILALSALPAAQTRNPLAPPDPLMTRIMRRELNLPNGGVTGAVRLGSGQTIAFDVEPLPSLDTASGLLNPPKIPVKRESPVLKQLWETRRRAPWDGGK